MLVTIGHREDLRHIGDVEDFCPICRSIQVFRVFEAFKATHVYFITVAREPLGMFTSLCTTCQSRLFHEHSPFNGIDSSWQETGGYPRAFGANARADMEAHVQSGDLSPAQRDYFLREPFSAMEDAVHFAKRAGISDARSNIAGVVLLTSFVILLGSIITLFFSSAVFGQPITGIPQWPFVLAMIVAPIIGIAAAVVMSRAPRRFAERHVVPRLVRSLQPLQPTVEEIRDLLAEGRAAKMLVSRIMTAEQLCEAIMQADEAMLHPREIRLPEFLQQSKSTRA